MERDAGFVVGVVVLGALLALAVLVARLRGRARRLERGAATQAQVLAAEQSRLTTLEQEQARALERLAAVEQAQVAAGVRGLGDELTIARVDESAAQVGARLDAAGTASAPSIEVHEDEGKTPVGAGEEVEEDTRHWTEDDAAPPTPPRDTIAMLAPSASSSGDDDGEATTVLEREPPRYGRPGPHLARMHPPEYESRRGFDGVPEAVSGRRLRPDEETPGRSLMVAREASE
jgi:hypothetical protein